MGGPSPKGTSALRCLQAREGDPGEVEGAAVPTLIGHDPRSCRALLAAAISIIHGIPLAQVLGGRLSLVPLGAKATRLERRHAAIWLAGDPATALDRLAIDAGDYMFPGRNDLQP